VFVDIKMDVKHFVDNVKISFDPSKKIALVSTIQFSTSLHAAKELLQEAGFESLIIPQEKPLSSGEILGCTSPKFDNIDILIYLGDGRFHLESIMISNPDIAAYQYDPYNKVFTKETYAIEEMHRIRKSSIEKASTAKKWGIILGTLGRQGNPQIMKRLEERLKQKKLSYVVILLSEIFPSKLDLFNDVEAWIQIACPRLSIDWGYAFKKPLLNPYEAEVALGVIDWQTQYPMDFYSKNGGEWTNYYNSQ